MCRWLAYSGSPLLLEDALYAPAHSLIEQSLHSRLGAETTNGDGFGVGWYGAGEIPALFRGTEPAWNDANLRELAAHVTSPLFFAHIRASSGTAVQQTNCHRSATAAGCSCTTASSTTSRSSSATWCSTSTRRCSRRSKARRTPRCCSISH